MDKDPVIYTEENMNLLKSVPALNDGQIYIYVLKNSVGNVKIGQTKNIKQRLTSLSGSNGGGSKVIALYYSPGTYLKSIEGTCHNHYDFARISGTEWFDGNKVDFDEVVKYVDGLFYVDSYRICNELRKAMYDNKRN